MVDAYCNHQDCKSPMDGAEYGMSLMDYNTKKEYMTELQEFHNEENHKGLKA